MDAPANALFGLIRATRAFEQKGCTSSVPLPTTTRSAAGRAASALANLLLGHASRADGATPLTLRGLREHIRELDSLIVRGAGMPPDLLLPIWDYRCELASRMTAHEGGAELSEVLDMLPDGARARRLAEEAKPPAGLSALRPLQSLAERSVEAMSEPFRGPPPQPETVPAPAPPPVLPPPGEAAPLPAPSRPVPVPASGDRIEGDMLRFAQTPAPPPALRPQSAAAVAEDEPLRLTREMLVPLAKGGDEPMLNRFEKFAVKVGDAISGPRKPA